MRPRAWVVALASLCTLGMAVSAPVAAAAPTLKGVPAFINQSLAALTRQTSYMTSTTMTIKIGPLRTSTKVTGYWVQHAGGARNYEVAHTTITTQGGTQHETTYSYQDAKHVCSRPSANAAWKCIPNTTKGIQAAMLPFVSVTHVKLLGTRRVLGQNAVGALLEIRINGSGAAAAGPSALTSALGTHASATATYWVSAATHLPVEVSVTTSASPAPIHVIYSDWNSPKITVPQVP